MGEEDLDRIAALLGPLSNPVRLRLLRFLTTPHYLEEIASFLMLTRQAARKHLDQLVAIGVLSKRSGIRPSGPVVEYVVDPSALFLVYDEFEKLGSLEPSERSDLLSRTMAKPGAMAPAPVPQGASLAVVRGMDVGRIHRLLLREADALLLGRDDAADVAIPHDPWASNRHAEIRLEQGRYLLADLRSTNGTFRNWTLLPPGGSATLRHGDLVGIGKTLLLFWAEAPRD